MNNWLRIVNKHRAAKNVVPEGWLTRSQVATQLGLHTDKRVNEVLRAALDAGDVETDNFPVWDKAKKRVVNIPCYRISEEGAPAKKPRSKSSDSESAKAPSVGGKVRHKLSGKVGVFAKEGSRWKIVWPHTRPSYPGERAFRRDLELL